MPGPDNSKHRIVSSAPTLPSLLLTNVNHILNKFAELAILVNNHKPDIVEITETWLYDAILDSSCAIPVNSVIRKARQTGPGGGVMFYVRNSVTYHTLDNVLGSSDSFEVLFISVRPHVLPLSCHCCSCLYSPPWYDAAHQQKTVPLYS